MIRNTLLQLPARGPLFRLNIPQAHFRRYLSSTSSFTPLTRETFISPDYVKIATTKSTMFTTSPEGVVEVPLLDSIKETGNIPQGYSIDFVLDPSRVVRLLAKQKITTVEQIPPAALEELKETINAPENLNIIPTSIYEMKQAIEAQSDAELDE
ncbi:hypothetical protein CVT26_004653 [Gymnopilus dilepis]|uniref:Uncharacterized protein n=1 Tax=Gymnopilus dilepis TaxID=231916 RepID=A0A409YTR1_9AGAR|nr:hypothetical protein CVT26_004653 [Gymnopilus dilepis]